MLNPLRRAASVAAVAFAGTLAMGHAALAQTEIQLWHAMGGELGEKTQAIADGFNKSQSDFKVVPVYKGTYTETMTGAIAAFRAKQAPHIVQVFEVGTASMMAAAARTGADGRDRGISRKSFQPI